MNVRTGRRIRFSAGFEITNTAAQLPHPPTKQSDGNTARVKAALNVIESDDDANTLVAEAIICRFGKLMIVSPELDPTVNTAAPLPINVREGK